MTKKKEVEEVEGETQIQGEIEQEAIENLVEETFEEVFGKLDDNHKNGYVTIKQFEDVINKLNNR